MKAEGKETIKSEELKNTKSKKKLFFIIGGIVAAVATVTTVAIAVVVILFISLSGDTGAKKATNECVKAMMEGDFEKIFYYHTPESIRDEAIKMMEDQEGKDIEEIFEERSANPGKSEGTWEIEEIENVDKLDKLKGTFGLESLEDFREHMEGRRKMIYGGQNLDADKISKAYIVKVLLKYDGIDYAFTYDVVYKYEGDWYVYNYFKSVEFIEEDK